MFSHIIISLFGFGARNKATILAALVCVMGALSGLSTECNTTRVVYIHRGIEYEKRQSLSRRRFEDQIGYDNNREDRDEKKPHRFDWLRDLRR